MPYLLVGGALPRFGFDAIVSVHSFVCAFIFVPTFFIRHRWANRAESRFWDV